MNLEQHKLFDIIYRVTKLKAFVITKLKSLIHSFVKNLIYSINNFHNMKTSTVSTHNYFCNLLMVWVKVSKMPYFSFTAFQNELALGSKVKSCFSSASRLYFSISDLSDTMHCSIFNFFFLGSEISSNITLLFLDFSAFSIAFFYSSKNWT